MFKKSVLSTSLFTTIPKASSSRIRFKSFQREITSFGGKNKTTSSLLAAITKADSIHCLAAADES